MINVTKTFLPPQKEYHKLLDTIWDKNWLTNRGPLVKQLEEKLKTYLDVSQCIATTNGTLPLQIAIKSLNLNGEIITTPFSYVATTTSIVWEGCTPVFVDIHPEYFTIDESKIEAAITEKTTAILATHVFGNPCDVKAIEKIASKYNLKVIYDAAHCFGVNFQGQSIFNFGDVSTCSFHATKVFHTAEGGALFANSKALNDTLFFHHNFGHEGPEAFQGIGTNAKMSEIQAAMGLAILPYMSEILEKRKAICDRYDAAFDQTQLQQLKIREGTEWNYCYYPVIFDSQSQLLKIISALKEQDIFPRRYFFPSLNKLSYVDSKAMPVSECITSRVLCLPLYPDLSHDDVDTIVSILLKQL